MQVKLFEATDVARAAAIKDAARHLQRTQQREDRQRQRETLASQAEDGEDIDELLARVRRGERIHDEDDDDE